jgi:DNA-binding response OmpR family regulator
VGKRSSEIAATAKAKHHVPVPRRVLLVDSNFASAEPASQANRSILERCQIDNCPVEVVAVTTLAEAQQQLSAAPIDLALIAAQLPDGNGLDLIRQISHRRGLTQSILLIDEPQCDLACEAIRAGAVDMLTKPLQFDEVVLRLNTASQRQDKQRATTQRIRRLRRLCKKLDQARKDVSGQVDVLCSDLVVAYQELATQMQQVVQTSEYGVLIREELDLEQLIRKTLEYIIEQAGPTNAAVFLPSGLDEFSLGGYVNYDCTSGSADMLLEHLADVVTPKIADEKDIVHLTNNTQLNHWIGDDAAYLADSHVLAVTAHHEDEALAVVILFRDSGEPFAESLIETTRAIAPLLGESLARLIRVHHRHLPDAEMDGYDSYDSGDIPF